VTTLTWLMAWAIRWPKLRQNPLNSLGLDNLQGVPLRSARSLTEQRRMELRYETIPVAVLEDFPGRDGPARRFPAVSARLNHRFSLLDTHFSSRTRS